MLDGRSTGQTLRALRRARRARHFQEEDLIDALYKSYLTIIGVGVAIFYLAPVLGEGGASADLLRQVREHGAAIAGIAVAIVGALGLRSGSRGGPLALEEADIAHVLLAPVSRGTALRAAARQQVRGVLYAGAVIGAVLGCLASVRLPGALWEWVLAAVAFSISLGLLAWGSALLGSGLRIGRRVASLAGALLVAGSVADLAAGTTISPGAQVGRIAVAPLTFSPLAIVGALLALIVAVAGLVLVGGSSIEAAQARAGLVGQLRFAATMQDVRTAMVLHRQLSQEQSRLRPWWRVRTSLPGRPTWYRDWQSLARWPGVRFVRSAVLGVIIGLALAAVWEGATALVIAAGVALYFVGLDAAEGLGQETDHLDRPRGYPRPWGDVVLGHLIVPACWCAVVLLVATGVAFVVTGSNDLLSVFAVALVPAAAAAAVAAGASLALATPSPDIGLGFGGMQELGPLLLVLRQVFPPVVVSVALIPFALTAGHGETPMNNAVGFLPVVVVVVAGIGWWLRSREVAPG